MRLFAPRNTGMAAVPKVRFEPRSLSDLPQSGFRPGPHSLRESVAGGT
jgi:hypothetical protein